MVPVVWVTAFVTRFLSWYEEPLPRPAAAAVVVIVRAESEELNRATARSPPASGLASTS